MSESPVLVRIDGRVASITLNRAGARNAIDSDMMTRLGDAIERASAEADVLVLRGAGADFSIGRDQHEKNPGQTRRESLGRAVRVNQLLGSFAGVTVAAVRGKAHGFSAGMAMQCDFTIASDDATFGFDEIKHGFPPTIVMTYLGQWVSKKVALDLLLSGRFVNGGEALRMGMVSRVVANDELERSVDGVLENLAARPVAALKRIKTYLIEIEAVAIAERPEYALNSDTVAPAS